MRYPYFKWYLISATFLTGPVHRESSEDMGMDEDDERDFEDLNYQPQEDDEDSDDSAHIQPEVQAGLKTLVKVLFDSMEFTADELESAVLSIPTPSDSLPDSGTSLREAIEVSLCQYMKDVCRRLSHMILHVILHVISYVICPGRHDSRAK